MLPALPRVTAACSAVREAGRTPVERDTLYNVVAEGEALAATKPFRRSVRRALEVVP